MRRSRTVTRALPRAVAAIAASAIAVAAIIVGAVPASRGAPRALEMPQAGAPVELRAVLGAVPDRRRGARLFAMCARCHEARGQDRADEWAPILAGQHPRVIAKQLVDYRYGIRWDARMERIAGLHVMPFAQDIADVAAYIGHLAPERTLSLGDGEWVAEGGELYTTLCLTCHGPDGAGSDARFIPRLAGQRYDYLLRQLHDVVDGRRPNMAAIHERTLSTLGVAELDGLADYLARLPSEPCRAPCGR